MSEDQKQERYITPEDEIRDLERRLEEKKKAFAATGEKTPEEKEMFRETLKERVEELAPSEERMPGHSSITPHPSGAKTKKDFDDEKEREEQVQALVEIALTKGIFEAVRIARATSPYLLDDLHDHLADDFYDKLIALRQINQL